jgi:hypothetical protein
VKEMPDTTAIEVARREATMDAKVVVEAAGKAVDKAEVTTVAHQSEVEAAT